MRAAFALLVATACGRLAFDPQSAGGDAPGINPGATRLDLAIGRHDPAGYADGTGVAARFMRPQGITTDGARLYIADSGNGTIRAVDPQTGTVSTIAGRPWGWGEVDGVGSQALFEGPTGIAYLGGKLYVADRDGETLRVVDPATGAVTTLAGMAETAGDTDGALLGQALFRSPTGIASDGTSLYVAEFDGCRVRKIDLAGGTATLLAGGTEGLMDGVGAAAQFAYPSQIAYAGGVLFVGDTWNHAVRSVDPTTGSTMTLINTGDGTVPAVAATATDVYFANESVIVDYPLATGPQAWLAGGRWSPGTMDGDATTARYDTPQAIALLGGTIYVADTANSAVRALDLATLHTQTLAGNFEPTTGPADGIGSAARFNELNAIATDGMRIWVTDESDYTIRQLDLATGSSTVISGNSGMWGTVDGTTAATYHRPAGITYAGNDTLYIVDRDSHRLRRLDLATSMVTTIGDPASYDSPGDVVYAGGVLYVADQGGQRVVTVDPATGVVTPLAGVRGTAGEQDGPGASALFYGPRGLAMCGGMLYVADEQGGALRRIDPATGEVTTAVAHGNPADGALATARVASPTGTECTADGLLVVDAGASALRRIDLASQTMSTITGIFGHVEDHDDVLSRAELNAPLAARDVGGTIVVLNASNLRVMH